MLELQQRLIAEKRIADDRETNLLRRHAGERVELQRQIAQARQRGAASRAQVTSLTAKLNTALAKERELVSEILRRDPASQILVGDLETELNQLSAGAAPAARRTIQRFATGDRAGAWSAFEPVARTGTGRDKRLAARLRMIMFNYQDPGVTAADVRSRWRAAVDADPENSLGWLSLATAEQYTGDVPAALAALAEASKRAKTPQERHLIAWQRSWTAWILQDVKLMIREMNDQLAAIRALAGTSVPAINRRWLEQQALTTLASYQAIDGNRAEAVTSLTEAARILEQSMREAPNTRFMEDALATTVLSAAWLQWQMEKLEDAQKTFQRAVDLLEKRIRDGPADAAPARASLTAANLNLCNIKQQQKQPVEALPFCKRVIELQKQQPRSAALDQAIAEHSGYVGRMLLALEREDEARAYLAEAAALWKSLAAQQSSTNLLAAYADTLHELAAVDDSVCWKDVAAAWASLEAKTQLTPAHQRAYERAKRYADRDRGCGALPAQSQRSTTPRAITTQVAV